MIDLVWGGRGRGTITTPSGHRMPVGAGASLSTDDLIAASAAASFMDAYLRTAADAGQPPLAYLSAATVHHGHEGATVRLRLLVSCGVGADEARAIDLVHRARRRAAIGQLLGERLEIALECRPLPEGCAPC